MRKLNISTDELKIKTRQQARVKGKGQTPLYPPFRGRAVSFSRKKKEWEIGGEGDEGIFVHKVLTNRKKSLYILLLLNLS
ncbi:hypothetical protein CSQ80_10915 [Cyanobacterium aponinum IPPAS B-1201]|nr:hypothetical protein CSQ80_10915 [Cyanobacterium aponinum IPPAS B-1201]